MDIIRSGETFESPIQPKLNESLDGNIIIGHCERCGYMSSRNVCKACVLLEGLNKGLPKLGIGNTDKMRRDHNLSGTETGPSIQKIQDLAISKDLLSPK